MLHAEITNVRPLLGLGDGTPSDQSLLIVVQRAPVVTATTPQADAANVLPKTAISLQLSGQNRGLRAIRLTNTNLPLTSDQPASTDDTTFAWALSAPLEQGKKYTGTVIDTNQPDGKQLLATYNFTTVAAPNVSSRHNGFLVPNSAIDITFDQDMVAAASVVATDMPGNGTWTDTRTYRFTAGAVQPGMTYVYTVPAGLQSAAGGTTPADRSFSVKTPGPVRVLSVRPTGSRAALSSTISVTFDQPVNHASAEAAFAILPAAAGSFGWSGNTMTFKPQGLHYQTTYTVTVAAGITPDFGLPGLAHSDSFMTTYEIKKLAVPFYRQAHALSCESASLRMALGHYGVHVVDDTVMALVGGSKGPRDTATNTWDDPYLTFVGNVDGRMGTTGWGVYSGPIAAAATSLGRQATAIGGGVTPAQVAAAIHAGNPVVLWGISGSLAREDSWNTTTSGVVRAPRNEHVRVVYGVEGSASDPVGFYLYDPLGSAAGLHWTTAQLRSNSAAGGGHAVIVR